ncbi:DUF397 domain-containing protein [Yinghuangia sp. YIM S09857]|uniref:DUF397 domain-containing protein n=1 Tax=Yinghuangia sp. YIM S09857 TaxID=3436929 RepID=UPI003F53130B
MTVNAPLRATWRKSFHSNPSGGNCVEVAQVWRKSSYSGASGGECVEVATSPTGLVPVRDSKDTARGDLMIPAQSWTRFTGALR